MHVYELKSGQYSIQFPRCWSASQSDFPTHLPLFDYSQHCQLALCVARVRRPGMRLALDMSLIRHAHLDRSVRVSRLITRLCLAARGQLHRPDATQTKQS